MVFRQITKKSTFVSDLTAADTGNVDTGTLWSNYKNHIQNNNQNNQP
jgi:hypothetical protein